MEQLNQKVISSQDETLFSAQVSGGYGYDETAKKWRRLACDSEGKQKIEATLELDSSGLAKDATLTDGSQKSKCMGIDTATSLQHQLKVASDGALHIISENFDSMLIKGVETGTTTQRDCKQNANGDLRTQLIGNDGNDGAGTMKIIKTNASGELSVNLGSSTTQNVNCFGKDGGGTARELLLEANGAFVLGGGSSSALGNTATDGSGTAKFLLCDAQGHLQVDIVSGGGGGGSTTHTIETKSVPDNTLTIIGDGTNAYIDTNGGSKFVISVLSATFTGSPAMSIEWSDNASFSAGKVFVCNGYLGGGAVISPVSLQTATRLDGTTLAIQGICAYDQIPARYARITIEQTSGGAIVYVGNSVLSP